MTKDRRKSDMLIKILLTFITIINGFYIYLISDLNEDIKFVRQMTIDNQREIALIKHNK